jgi:hypothetical protein
MNARTPIFLSAAGVLLLISATVWCSVAFEPLNGAEAGSIDMGSAVPSFFLLLLIYPLGFLCGIVALFRGETPRAANYLCLAFYAGIAAWQVFNYISISTYLHRTGIT